MNLSSYLQMPPAPSVPSSPSTALPAGAATGVSPVAGASLGLDFAKIMARQFERMPQVQRQAFAAPQEPGEAELTRANAQAQSQAKNTQTSERQAYEQQTQDQHEAQAQDADRARADAHSADARTDHGHVTARANKKQPTDTTPQAPEAGMTEVASGVTPMATSMVTPVVSPVAPTPAHSEVHAQALKGNPYLKDVSLPSSDASQVSLRTVELSPHMRIITDARKAPSPESLTAFAKSMGLDEEAIQKLMGPPTEGSTAPAAQATSALPQPASASKDSLGAMTGLPGASAGLGATAGLGDSAGLVAGAASGATLPNTSNPILSLATQTPNVVGQAAGADNGATPAATLGNALQGLNPTDLASIEHMQINVVPSAVSSAGLTGAGSKAAIAAPSTASVLSMLGGGLSEHDIHSLVVNFEAGTAGGESATSQGGSDSGAGSFAQNMPRPALPNAANASTSAPTASQVHMSEVYDQLSDKMATEMAARMHKQLSDGEWKMKFGLRPANLGGVEIQLEMKDGKLNAMIQADNPLTRDLLQNSSQRLRDALENFGIQAGQVQIGQDSRGTQQNPSRDTAKQAQVGDNSISQVKGSDNTTGDVTASVKASASLLDLYA